MKDAELFLKLSSDLKAGRAGGYAVIIDEHLSSPRGAGAKMIMDHAGRTSGTIGGGTIEALVISEMKKLLKQGGIKTLEYALDMHAAKNIGMMCGGKVKVYIEMYGQAEEAALLGGGHIALALALVLDSLGMPYHVFDDRKEYVARERFPNAAGLYCAKFPSVLSKYDFGPKTYTVIATRCHAHDVDCLRYLLKKELPYIGLIASKTKVTEVIGIFSKEGTDIRRLKNLYSPCGLATGGDSPEYIALSIAAEISMVRHKGKPAHMKSPELAG